MKIGIVCPYNYYRHGGVQICVKEIADELEKRGHTVKILAPRPRKKPATEDSRVVLIGGSTEFNTPFATKSDLGLSASNEKIDQLLAAENFDVLHFHEPGAPVLPVQVLSRSQTCNVGTMHAALPGGMMTKSYQKMMAPLAKYVESHLHAVTAVSEIARITAQTYLPNNIVDITIVPNGINIADYAPKAAQKQSSKIKTIVYIGRLEKRKGVRYLLEAYALLRQDHEDVRLIIAGDGDLRSSLEAKVKKYSIPDVSFAGFVSEEEKVRLMQTADIYCSPALYGESFGIVLLEAMAAGCVVVAGNNPGYASVMTGRGRLSLVTPTETTDFAQRLELMLYDKDIRELWLNWAKTYVQQYDYSKVVDQYEATYRKALKIYTAKKS